MAKSMCDPGYREPLYETALHEGLINADCWELPTANFPTRSGTAPPVMLYNTPLNYVLDGKTISTQ
ncbi:glycoside hydrolase [Streptomyces sp. NPDC058579]|uniref:glycoside hydrolase n=1 Tax=Streptomyces sp. NPDC058579 TaxID=3346548 RepID=UPI0036476BC2